MKTYDLVLVALCAAILAVISQIALPIASVPITIQVFGVALIGVILGWKKGILSVLVYILLGAIGLPIFANFRGGFSVLFGATGGYIVAWLVMVVLCGLRFNIENKYVNWTIKIVLAIVGLMIVETVGGLWWYFVVQGTDSAKTFGWIMAYSFTAFIPKDILITVLGVVLGENIRKPLIKAGFIK